MTFRTMPAFIAPGPEDRAALDRKRAELADRLEAHEARERRIVLGVASEATIDCVMRNKHLSRVLAGPVPLFKRTGTD